MLANVTTYDLEDNDTGTARAALSFDACVSPGDLPVDPYPRFCSASVGKLDNAKDLSGRIENEEMRVQHAAQSPHVAPSIEQMRAMAVHLHPGVKVRLPLSRIPRKSYTHAKRVIDIVCALLALVVLSPVFAACAIAVKATSEGPVSFRQQRWGAKHTRFECWKFRTMIEETPPNMPAALFEDKAAFMTPLGDFLRRWSLDELPQLVNILRGDMSVIGPRPVIIQEERLIDLRDPVNADAVRPGLTGWAQVNGRNLVSDEEKAFLDGEYVANMSLVFDCRVFFRTIAVVVSRRGVDRDAPSGRKSRDRR